jgi:hypothetical protein
MRSGTCTTSPAYRHIPWVSASPPPADVPTGSAARSSGALLDAMDGLRPARSGVPERSARIHRLLVLRYRDGLEPSAVRTLLGIGKSEYHREQTRGLCAVASLLWEQLSANQGRSRLQPTAETDAAHLALPRYSRKVAGVLAQQPLW